MKRNLLIVSVLVLTLGLAWSVYAKGFYKLEAFASLSKEKQTLIIDTMKKNHEAKKELWGQMKEAKKGMHEALTAPKFDAANFQANADKIEALKAQKFKIMTDSIKELAPQLTQEEREVLAKILPKGKRGHGHGYHGKQCGK